MLRNALIVFVLLSFLNCKEKENQKPIETSTTESAEDIIQKAIEVAGGDLFRHSKITFDFRDLHFKAIRNQGKFQLERYFLDSIPEIKDVLTNSGFERSVNGEKVSLADSTVSKYSNSVNSVHYFSVLPYGLNGRAVHKEYLGSSEIKGKDYHKIKVTFSEDGGGDDYEDQYIYWVNKEGSTVDYLGYTYIEADGSQGFRFREAYNARNINGIRFVDYDNYKPETADVDFMKLDEMFGSNQLTLLSKIELKNIEVEALN